MYVRVYVCIFAFISFIVTTAKEPFCLFYLIIILISFFIFIFSILYIQKLA